MSPTQAREVIEAAGERIADWKSRLRINTGRGVETWDNQGNQLVSVSTSSEEVVKERQNFTVILWATLRRVRVLDPIDIPPTNGAGARPGFRLSEGGVFVDFKDRHQFMELNLLESGQYSDEESYKESDKLKPADPDYFPAGYFSPLWRGVPFYGYEALYIPVSAEIGPSGWQFTNHTVSTVTIELSIRAYTPAYLYDRSNRGLDVEFSKGQSVGYYDMMIRQLDADRGPTFSGGAYSEPGTFGGRYSTTAILTSTRQRIGFEPTTLTFNSRNNGYNVASPGWQSPGLIEIMGYRKV